MKLKHLIPIVIAFSLFSCTNQKMVQEYPDYVKYVNPLIGTTWKSNAGAVPAVTQPFGMVQFVPATEVNKIGMTPYHYESGKIIGFMATHQPAVWMGDYGYLTFWPGIKDIKLKPSERGFAYSHDNEISTPYYYRAILNVDSIHSITGEFTASARCGYFRFSYPENSDPNLVFEMSRQKEMETIHKESIPQVALDYIKNTRKDDFRGWVKIDKEKNEIIGYNPDRHSYYLGPQLNNFRGYFVIQFNKSFNDYGVWEDFEILNERDEKKGNHVGAFVKFDSKKVTQLELKVGISFISIEQARENLIKELPEWNFDKAKENLKTEWNKKLQTIELTKATEDQKTIFYTAMYRSLTFPRIFSEHGKYYSAFDDKVHDGVSYNDYSLWDTFRALHPLLIFIAPAEVPDMITALIQMYKEGGWIPKWPNPSYTNIMIGTHADAVIADAYVKGVKGVDYNLAYEAIRKNAFIPPAQELDSTQWNLSPWKNYELTPKTSANPWWDRAIYVGYEARAGLTFYDKLGYVPQDKTRESVSLTLEYAYDDFCVAQVAKGLGKMDDYKYLMNRSKNYKNVYNPATGMMAIKNSQGNWMKDSLELKGRHVGPEAYLGFTEGSPYTYQFCAMHDVEGLIDLMGGTNSFVKKLDNVFEQGHFVHQNEPCHHYPYLYNYAGEPEKTQKYARQYTLSQYKTGPNGIDGNDDCGQMSAWYIFSSLGFYPVAPGKTEYAIGSPMFEEATIHLPNGKKFTIKTINNSDENAYISKITLNGKQYSSFFIDHKDIMNGGEMVFEMKGK